DYSTRTLFDTVRVSQSNRHLGSTLSFEVSIVSKSLPRPKGFQQVVISRNSDGARLFGGIIHRVDQIEDSLPAFNYRILAADYTRWLDHVPIGGGGIYPKPPETTVDGIVRQIVAD